jgi:hypothetical protein
MSSRTIYRIFFYLKTTANLIRIQPNEIKIATPKVSNGFKYYPTLFSPFTED